MNFLKTLGHCPDRCGSAGQLVGRCPTKPKVAGWIPVRAHAWVVDSVPVQDMYGKQPIGCFSPSLCLPAPLKMK